MSDEDELRAILLEHSDHRAVRRVFGAYTGTGTADLVDSVEAMRATDGDVALVASDGAADVYARWDGSHGRYEHLTMWPPWSIGGYDYKRPAELTAHLETKENVRPILSAHTPFSNPETLASMTDRIWP